MFDGIIEFVLRLFMDAEDYRHRKEMPEFERRIEENRGFDPKKRDTAAKIMLISYAVIAVVVVLIALITK